MTHCKKPGLTDIQLYYNSKDIPNSWNEFLLARHFLKTVNLALTEKADLPDLEYIYALVTQNGKPAAAIYFQLLGIKEEHFNTAALRSWQGAAWKLFTTIAHPKLLVAGHLFRHDISSLYIAEDIPAFDAYQLYKTAIDKVLRESCANAVLVKDMPEQLATYFQHYAPQFIMLRNDISMEMEMPENWQHISDYEKALKHKYAQRFRKIRSAFSEVDIRELSAVEVLKCRDELYALYLEVCEKQQARIGYLSPGYLPLLKQQYGDALKVWAAYHNDEMVAFFSAWVRQEVFDMFYIGFDYSRNAELQLYFNILFFAVEQAIAFKKQKLVLGRTALDAKARLGCRPHYLSTFVYIRNRYLRNMIAQVQKNALAHEGEWEQRHPLKGKSL